jgi:cellulose synthase/poly-beta-1,6-N-acetylglucosamine synthase-like glycosyltransferase
MIKIVINGIISAINSVSGAIGDLLNYKTIYKIVGLFATRKFKPAKNNHKYAILVAARNEQAVIGNLIDSIRQQDYPAELVDIFVVADNCDKEDRTAEVAREMGAICYERHDLAHRTKGFALQYLVECIRRDYGIDAYEGYFIFDADNLLKEDFISRMNDSFDAGEKIVTSYRNTKNFDDNWISASYGVHWLRTVRNEHRARSLFRLATRIQGTGFLFAWEVIKDGWNYTSLTEDRAFCADAVANGYKISYNHDAEFYDEQPVDMKTAWVQRIRWAKGHLQAFAETGPQLATHIFITDGKANRPEVVGDQPLPTWKKFLNNIRLRFMSFDMLAIVYPRSIFLLFKKIVVYALRVWLICLGLLTVRTWFAPDWMAEGLKLFGIDPVFREPLVASLMLCLFGILWTVNSYLSGILTAAYVFIIEHRRITKIKWYKKVWFCLTFPIFDIIGKLAMYIALFRKVEWKPTPHKAGISISELKNKHRK